MRDPEIDAIIGAYEKGENPTDKTNHSRVKPPLGVMPEAIYEGRRISNLCEAIIRQINFESPDYNLMHEWAEEICRKTCVEKKADGISLYCDPIPTPTIIVFNSTNEECLAKFCRQDDTFEFEAFGRAISVGEKVHQQGNAETRIITEVMLWSFPSTRTKIKTAILHEAPTN